MATVGEEQEVAPLEHLVQFDPVNPYPAKQVTATVLEVQVAAPVPQALHVLAVAFKKYPTLQVKITPPLQELALAGQD